MKATLLLEFEPGERHRVLIGGVPRVIVSVRVVRGHTLPQVGPIARVVTRRGNDAPVVHQAMSVYALPGEVRELLGLQP